MEPIYLRRSRVQRHETLEAQQHSNRVRVKWLRNGVGTKRLIPRMDCGWQNQGWEASNHSEFLKSLASNTDCIERAAPPQTSGTRDALPRFTMLSQASFCCLILKQQILTCPGRK